MERKTKSTARWLLALTCLLLAGMAPGDAEAKKRRQGKAETSRTTHDRGGAQGVVNINTATDDQIQLLPGIGPSKSRAIIKYRTRHKFKATYALIRVRGIGRKTYRKLRSYLTVRGPTTLTAKPRQRRARE